MGSKRYLVLGSGVGKAIAYMLAKNANTRLVVIGDIDTQKSVNVCDFVSKFYKSKCIPMRFDVEKTPNQVAIFKQFDVIISALPAKYNLQLAETAIEANVHFCDLGGVVEVTNQMMELNLRYPNLPVSIIPDCGLMPGLGIILAKKLMQDLGGAESIEILVGGLPQKPRPPVFYQCVFSPEGLRHICYDPAPILSEGEVKWVKPFHDYSQLEVSELQRFSRTFNGRVETFITSGASIAAWSFQKLGVKNFAEKTVRWPGFVDFFKTVPPYKFDQAVDEYLTAPVDTQNPDLVWMRVTAKKADANPKSVSLLDLYDNQTGLTAMQRTTGFTTAVVAEMMAEGKTKSGICTPENAFNHSGINEMIDRISQVLNFKEN